jgi:hypothetical protein
MIAKGEPIPVMLNAVWDIETMSLFSTIIAFWFGSRIMEKRERLAQEMLPEKTVTTTVRMLPKKK